MPLSLEVTLAHLAGDRHTSCSHRGLPLEDSEPSLNWRKVQPYQGIGLGRWAQAGFRAPLASFPARCTTFPKEPAYLSIWRPAKPPEAVKRRTFMKTK